MNDATVDETHQTHLFQRSIRRSTKKERESGKPAWHGSLRLPSHLDDSPWGFVVVGDTLADIERQLDEDEQSLEREQPFELESYFFVPGEDKPGSFILREKEEHRIWIGSVLVGSQEWGFWDRTKFRLLKRMIAWVKPRLLPITLDQLETLAQAEQDRLIALFYALKAELADEQGE